MVITRDTMSELAPYMRRALILAAKGGRIVMPNPMVGAVIVHKDRIIGEGYHEVYGGPHAEVNAIRAVQDPTLLKESTLFVTLEPCAHFGKTPPCADLVIESGIPHVAVGCRDPFPQVAGRGIAVASLQCMRILPQGPAEPLPEHALLWLGHAHAAYSGCVP